MNTKGYMISGTLGKSQARFTAIDSSNMTIAAKKVHNASLTASATLGRVISAGALMGGLLKNKDDRTTMTINGGGISGAIVCTSYFNGLVKAYIDNPTNDIAIKDNGVINVSEYVGTNGRISVMRDTGLSKPYVGQCELQTGEIAQDLAYYYLQSEQIPSLVALGVSYNNDGTIHKSGGIIIQAMPGCSDELLDALEIRSMIMSDISKQLEVMELKEFITAIFDGLDMSINKESNPSYECDCFRGRIEQVLMSMGRDELLDMAHNDNGTQISCHFCNTEYEFSKQELLALLESE